MSKALHFRVMDTNSDHYFIIYEGKENVILKSVGFKSKEQCVAALSLVKECGGDEENYLRMISPAEEFYFMLRDNKRRELGVSAKAKSREERNKMLYKCIRFIKSSRFKPSSFVAGDR